MEINLRNISAFPLHHWSMGLERGGCASLPCHMTLLDYYKSCNNINTTEQQYKDMTQTPKESSDIHTSYLSYRDAIRHVKGDAVSIITNNSTVSPA